MEELRHAISRGTRTGARRPYQCARGSEGTSSRVDRGSIGAFREGDGTRYAVASKGDPGEMAGTSEGTLARAARRARAVGEVSRRVRRRLPGARIEAQAGRRPEARRSPRDG